MVYMGMRKYIAALAVAAIMLAACVQQYVSAQATKPAAADSYYLRKGDVVLMMGDSITFSAYYTWIFYDDLKKKYPELGVKDARGKADFKAAGITFINGGVGGETAGAALKRVDSLIETHKPTVAVLCYGMNDRFGDRAGYKNNLRALVKKFKTAGVDVTVLTAPCVDAHKDPKLEKYVALMGELAQEARQVADEEGVSFADCYPATKEKSAEQDITRDGVHPTKVGQRLMCDALEEAWGFGKPLTKEGAPRPRAWAPSATPASAPTSNPAPSPAPTTKLATKPSASAPADTTHTGATPLGK